MAIANSVTRVYLAEGAKNASWPWLSRLQVWDSLTMTYVCMTI